MASFTYPNPNNTHTPQTTNKMASFTYYISPHESSRVEAAVDQNFSAELHRADDTVIPARADFVWLHTPTQHDRQLREASTIVSQLSGIEVLENKANLALLEQDVAAPTLASFVVKGRAGFVAWAQQRAQDTVATVWIAKDASANGGQGLFVFSTHSWETTAAQLDPERPTVYVVQRYVERPLLWENQFKFHFRVYCVLTADRRMWCYRRAFAHVANKPFALDAPFEDTETHITNVAANVHNEELFHPYPIVDLPSERPHLWAAMGTLFASLMTVAAPFMRHQLSVDHFVLIGADFLPDADGRMWLLELNSPPCLGAYQGGDAASMAVNPMEQAIAPLVTSMMRDVINDFVLCPLENAVTVGVGAEKGVASSSVVPPTAPRPMSTNFVPMGVAQEVVVTSPAELKGKNQMAFALFKWKKRRREKMAMKARAEAVVVAAAAAAVAASE